MNAKRLTKQEEMDILREAFKYNHFIDNGSSRAVYKLNESQVIKVAFDDAGKKQNANELAFYEENSSICAPIYAYGEYILVSGLMIKDLRDILENAWEEVYYGDDDDLIDDMHNYIFNEEEDLLKDMYKDSQIEEALNIIDIANGINGTTVDNTQIGVFADDSVRLYDYGFIVDVDNLIGDIDGYLYENGTYGLLLKIVRLIMKTLSCNNIICYIRTKIYKDRYDKIINEKENKKTNYRRF